MASPQVRAVNHPASTPIPRPVPIPSPDRRTEVGGHFLRRAHPATLDWISIEPDGTLLRHQTANLAEFRDDPYRRWWQYLVDEAIGRHIDPGCLLAHFGGRLIWHSTPSLGLVLRASPHQADPTSRLPNPVAGRMLNLACGTTTQLDQLIRGPAVWIGGYDGGAHFYLPFSDVRRNSLLDLHRIAKAAVKRGDS